jgi:hypothetical protein
MIASLALASLAAPAGLPRAIGTATLPESSHSGYVAAAYIVFFVLVLVYVAIMAWRLTRVERAVRDLRARGREQAPDEREREVV